MMTFGSMVLVGILCSVASVGAKAMSNNDKIDRHALVTRHNIGWSIPNGQIPLGNGEFCFNTDGTGLQTFCGDTLSHWGWHSFPLPAGYAVKDVPATGTFQQGRNKGPDIFPPGTDALRTWMFDNPHVMNLARIRLVRADGSAITPENVAQIDRVMNLWTGVLESSFKLDGKPVRVVTCVHPKLDAMSVRVLSPLVGTGAIGLSIDFPYPNLENSSWIGDFANDGAHKTETRVGPGNRAEFHRVVDAARYEVAAIWSENCKPISDQAGKPHAFRITPTQGTSFEATVAFAPAKLPVKLPTFQQTRKACERHWESFWQHGGAIDLSGSRDSRWMELERRIVLSQYLTAVQSAGSFPPAETGLMGIDPWRSQFHMEMVWWHLAHFALWDRWSMAEKALSCYQRFLPVSKQLAAQLGYKGAKWPKSVGPEGRSAPWVGNQVLLWKQPHPLFFAELEYRLKPARATLNKWSEVVFATAEHMADYPTFDPASGEYSLVPSMPPSEQGITRDTVFDLAYWRWGLDEAQRWRERLGLPREPKWDEVRKNLAPLPTLDGVFIHSPEWTDTYTKRAWEHPDPIGVFGMLPPIEGVDEETAHRTVLKVWKTWDWNRCWGWDFPWMAMAAARTGEPDLAIDALLKDAGYRNYYDTRGVNTGGPSAYLPGNGGLLYAVAMMAAGWDGGPSRHAPGFPNNGDWVVRWEGLKKAP